MASVWAGCLLLVSGREALASGFLNPRLADPHGHPALANPYAIYFNPGALGGMTGTNIVVDATLAYRHASFDRAASGLSPANAEMGTDPTYIAANTGRNTARDFLVIPFLGGSTDFGTKNFFAGVGFYVPFGGEVEWAKNTAFAGRADARGAIDGSQRWAVISGTHRSLYNTVAAGFRLPDAGFSLGVSASAVLSSINHVQARNPTGSDDSIHEGRALIEVTSVDPSVAVGVLWEPVPRGPVRIGASYSSRPNFGEMRMTGTLRQSYATPETMDADLLISYPDVFRFGVAARVSRALELRFDSEYVTWSVVDRQCVVGKGGACARNADGSDANPVGGQIVLAVPRRWQDAGAMRFGAGYWIDEPTELYGSAGFDTSAVGAATLDATVPDAFKLMGSLGVRRRFGGAMTLGASFTVVDFLERSVGPQRIYPAPAISAVPNQDGKYSSLVMFLHLNAGFAF